MLLTKFLNLSKPDAAEPLLAFRGDHDPGIGTSFRDLVQETAWYLGYGFKRRQSDGLSVDQEKECVQAIHRGYEQYLYPPLVPPDVLPHRWSWLNPVTTITAAKTFSSVLTTIGGNRTLTATADVFQPTMVGRTITATAGASYVITQYATARIVGINASAAADTGKTFTLTADGLYRLPDDFAGFRGEITYKSGEGYYAPIASYSEVQLRMALQNSNTTGRPIAYAVRPVRPSVQTGQKWDLVLWPIPDSNYDLSFQYTVAVNKLSDANPFPIGGPLHAGALIASCLAAAECRSNDERGLWAAKFMERMRTSIDMDRMLVTPERLGEMRDPGVPTSLTRLVRSKNVTYKGVAY